MQLLKTRLLWCFYWYRKWGAWHNQTPSSGLGFSSTGSCFWTSELTVLPKQTQAVIFLRTHDLTVPIIFSLVESLNDSRRTIIPQNTRCWASHFPLLSCLPPASPLIPLDLLYAVLPKILPSYPTPQSCQQLPTFLLAKHLAHPHLTISYTHPQPVISSSLFHIKP